MSLNFKYFAIQGQIDDVINHVVFTACIKTHFEFQVQLRGFLTLDPEIWHKEGNGDD